MADACLVVGALIRDERDRVLVQYRSRKGGSSRSCWDVIGGPVRTGATLMGALRREIEQSTGWRLHHLLTQISHEEWFESGMRHIELDYLVDVDGNLDSPSPERAGIGQFAWIGADDVDLLVENPEAPGGGPFKETVRAALKWLATSPARPSQCAYPL